jgi:hypothetical protein
MRALFAVLAVALVLAACSDTPTDPTAAASGLELASETLYCPAQFTPVAGKGTPEDNNGDGTICELLIIHPDEQSKVLVYVDNNVPVQLGVCPEGFEVVKAVAPKPGEPTVDRNGDGFACQASRPNGNVVVIDNRFDVEKTVEKPPAEPTETTK